MTIQDLHNIFRRHTHEGIEDEKLHLFGTAAPNFAPKRTGMFYFDTTNAKVYGSCGTSTSADWKILN